jgi:hypothetical protein
MGPLVGLRICKTGIPRASELMFWFQGITRVCPCCCTLFLIFYRFVLFPLPWFFRLSPFTSWLWLFFVRVRFCLSAYVTPTGVQELVVICRRYCHRNTGCSPVGGHRLVRITSPRVTDFVDSTGRRVRVCVLLAVMAVDLACKQGVIPRKIRMKRRTPLRSTRVFPYTLFAFLRYYWCPYTDKAGGFLVKANRR